MEPWKLFGVKNPGNRRKFRNILLAGAAAGLLFLILAGWAALSLFGWLKSNAPPALEALRGQAEAGVQKAATTAPEMRALAEAEIPALMQKISALAPVAGRTLENWLPSGAVPGVDVAGEEPADIPRYEGFIRVHYAAENGERAATYRGRGDFRAVAAHYTARFAEKGWSHRVLSAEAGKEKHEYLAKTARYELDISGGGVVTVIIRRTPATGVARPPAAKEKNQ
ncbi:MAG: hypothetical protein FD189_2447 [Elusimicrobia bacterium]|nr:MAG: hypothetical protein FD154_2347 [Elusimicrobiota bacterium]KAF0152724.1 MAG: hypothetical protein FD189_2447 [Elusimicrobiota bacterium]